MSSRTARAPVELLERRDARPVTISPPSERSYAARASASCWVPPPGERPAEGVGRDREHEAERRRRRPAKVHHRMGAEPGKQRPGRRVAEPAPCQIHAGAQRRQAEPDGRERVSRHPQHRPEDERDDPIGLSHQRPEQLLVGAPVVAEAGRRGRDRALEQGDPAVVERVRQRRGRVDQLDAAGGRGRVAGRRAMRPRSPGWSSRRRGRSRGASAPRCASRRRLSRSLRRRRRKCRLGPG